MTATKVAVLVLRIPEHLGLHFYDVSTILYIFYKFAAFRSKEVPCVQVPETCFSFATKSLAGL